MSLGEISLEYRYGDPIFFAAILVELLFWHLRGEAEESPGNRNENHDPV